MGENNYNNGFIHFGSECICIKVRRKPKMKINKEIKAKQYKHHKRIRDKCKTMCLYRIIFPPNPDVNMDVLIGISTTKFIVLL